MYVHVIESWIANTEFFDKIRVRSDMRDSGEVKDLAYFKKYNYKKLDPNLNINSFQNNF